MRRNFFVSAVALVAVAAGSLSASAGEARRIVYKPRTAPVAAQQVAQTTVAADQSVAQLQARVAELTKRVQSLEAAAAESRRQLATLSNQLEQAVSQPIARPVVNQRVVEPTIIITNDLYPNEYPYGG